MFDDCSLDIVYIDADHTRCAEDIAAWWPKMRAGGWLTGHDYTMNPWITVREAVNRFANVNALVVYVIQAGNDETPSWAIRKPAEIQ